MSRPIQIFLAACAILFLSLPAFAQDSLTLKALGRIEEVEQLETGLQSGDKKSADLYLNKLAWARKRLDAVGDHSEATWVDASARHDAVKAKIEKKAGGAVPPAPAGYDYAKLVQLNKEIASAYENLKMLSLKFLRDESRVRGIRKELAGFTSRMKAFPADDDNVKIVAGNLAGFQKLFDAGMAQLGAGEELKGGMLTELQRLRAKYESKNTPGNLSFPFDEQQVRAWAAEMRRWRGTEIPTDLKFLREAAANPAVDQNPVNSLYHWLTGTWMRRLNEVEKLVRERIASEVVDGERTAQYVLETDPKNRSHVLSRILSKGRFDEVMLQLKEARHGVAIARIYDQAMGSPAVLGPTITDAQAAHPAQPDRAAQEKLIDRAVAHLKRIVDEALNDVRMPPAASTDPALIKIAEETLRNPDYEVAGWERLVINADKRPLVRREAWFKPGSSNVTLSYYEYIWDEFQVTTAEQEEGKLWLYANTLKLYSSGDLTTPVGRWILSRRYRLTPILAENLKK